VGEAGEPPCRAVERLMRFHFAGDGDRGRSRCQTIFVCKVHRARSIKVPAEMTISGEKGGGWGEKARARARRGGARRTWNFKFRLDSPPPCFANSRQDKYAGDNLFRNLFTPAPLALPFSSGNL